MAKKSASKPAAKTRATPTRKPKAGTAKKPPAKKQAAPKKATPAPSKALVALYEGLQANVFETVFAGDAKLIAAFLAWAKKTHPRWNDEVDDDQRPWTRAIRLETLITDEVEESAFVAFFDTLPAAQKQAAVQAMKKASAAGSGDDREARVAAAASVPGAITIAGVVFKPGDKKLSFHKRPLNGLLEQIAQCTSVEVLDLVNCNLTSLPAALGKLAKLKKLNLSENKELGQLPPELAQCTQLDYILLYDCPNAIVPPIPSLKHVLAQATSVATVKSLCASTSLETLLMMNCGATAVPEEVRALKKLDTLDLSDNKITKLPRWLTELSLTTVWGAPESEAAWLATFIPA